MALPDDMWRDIVRYIREHPEAEEELRSLVLSKEMLAVPVRLMEITAALERLTESDQELRKSLLELDRRIATLTSRVDALTERLDRLGDTVDRLADVVERLVVRMEDMNARLDRHDGRMGNIEGGILEERYSRRLRDWLRSVVRNPRQTAVVDLDLLERGMDESAISADEYEDVFLLDLVAVGRTPGGQDGRVVAAELSYTINTDDIVRADRRTQVLRKVGYDAVAFTGGYRVTDDARVLAERLGVHIDLRRPPE